MSSPNGANQFIQSLVREYQELAGYAPVPERHYVPVDPELAQRIAQAYDALAIYDTDALRFYRALGQEVKQQFRFLVFKGLTFEPWTQEGQPYATSSEMCLDVATNQHLFFFQGGEPHPMLDETDASGLSLNDLFRCVHDIFGHAAEGYQFGARGEENAWIHHSTMFSPLAQRALTSETRGQNSWVNFGPHSALSAKERPYATQKCALLPVEFSDWQSALARE